jgi:steroid delta-isomerase-like uncharacterized protein
MTNASNVEALARRILELLDSKDYAAFESHVSPRCRIHMGGDDLDRAGWIAHSKAFYEGFPDGHFHIERQLVAGNAVTSIGTWGGTHLANFMGMPPTGKKVSIRVLMVHQFEDGKLVEHWGQFDSAGMMRQLGSEPA